MSSSASSSWLKVRRASSGRPKRFRMLERALLASMCWKHVWSLKLYSILLAFQNQGSMGKIDVFTSKQSRFPSVAFDVVLRPSTSSATHLTRLFFGHFEKNSRPKKLKQKKNSSKFSKKLKQIIRKLNISPTRINFFFPQKLII